MRTSALLFVVLVLAVMVVVSAGCVKVSKAGETTKTSENPKDVPVPQVLAPDETIPPENTAPPVTIPTPPPVMVARGTPTPTPHVSSVTDSLPDLPPNLYQEPNGTLPDSIPSERYPLTPIYTTSFSNIRNESRGVIVDVVTPPMMITYTVTKRNWADVNGKPLSDNPRWSYFVITVRDNATRQWIGEDGFGDIYSTEETKSMVFYTQGTYHVTFTGNMVDATVTISTGDAPGLVKPVATSTPVTNPEDEEDMG